MDIINGLFWGFIVIPIALEFIKLSRINVTEKILNINAEIKEVVGDSNIYSGTFFNTTSIDLMLILLKVLYLFWGIFGLFTEQWVLFLLFLLMQFGHAGFNRLFETKKTVLLRMGILDNFTTLLLFIVMIIDRFHYKLI